VSRGRSDGHKLARAGWPHDVHGQPMRPVSGRPERPRGKDRFWLGERWEGRAKCQCGWLSEPLPTTAERKRAHQAHKAMERKQQEQAEQEQAG